MTLSERLSGLLEASRAIMDKEWFNWANMFTLLRVMLAPPVIVFLIYRWNIAAGLIFIAAALTDKADGYYARKYDAVTPVGQFLDPLADKLLMLPVIIALGVQDLMPIWVVSVVVARELMVSIIRIIGARRSISFPASWSGKTKMFSQIVAVSVLLFFPGSVNRVVVQVLVYAMAAITIYSGIDYVVRARREIFGGKQHPEETA